MPKTGDALTHIHAPGIYPCRNWYQPGQARVIATDRIPPSATPSSTFRQDSTSYSFDQSGNQQYSYRRAAHGEGSTVSETRQFYGGDEQLRVVQRVEVTSPDGMSSTARGVWEEYRYDPLGRRIMVRTRTDADLCNVDPWTCTGSITRFVWAGDQILWELKAPGNGGANLEATTGSGNAYGQVSYTHAGGIDRPLIITKDGVSVVPHQNWRGIFALATGTDGQPSAADIDWPGYHTTPWHGATRVVENWFGSLSTGMRDASGLMYMRNRYYNPATGQFTQPDPIGLAGGLNSYGFAEGDPVSYSDPYGLCAASQVQAAPKDAPEAVCPGGLSHGQYYQGEDGFTSTWDPAPGSSCAIYGCILRLPQTGERERVERVLRGLRTDILFCTVVAWYGLDAANRDLRYFNNVVKNDQGKQIVGNAPFDTRLGGVVMYLYGKSHLLYDHDIVHEAVHAVPRLFDPVQGYPDATDPFYYTPLGSIDQTAAACRRS